MCDGCEIIAQCNFNDYKMVQLKIPQCGLLIVSIWYVVLQFVQNVSNFHNLFQSFLQIIFLQVISTRWVFSLFWFVLGLIYNVYIVLTYIVLIILTVLIVLIVLIYL